MHFLKTKNIYNKYYKFLDKLRRELEYFDEEGLLQVIKIFELSEEITKLNWNWSDDLESVKKAHEIMTMGQKLFLEVSEYEKRMGSKLNKLQRDKINDALTDLGELIPYMKNKIKPYESLENSVDINDL